MRLIRVLRYEQDKTPIPYSALDEDNRHPDGTWKHRPNLREWQNRPWPFDVNDKPAMRQWMQHNVPLLRRQGGRVQVITRGGQPPIEYHYQGVVKPVEEE